MLDFPHRYFSLKYRGEKTALPRERMVSQHGFGQVNLRLVRERLQILRLVVNQ